MVLPIVAMRVVMLAGYLRRRDRAWAQSQHRPYVVKSLAAYTPRTETTIPGLNVIFSK
jgi:hypothetical protein